MINTSNEYKQIIKSDNRQFYAGVEITLADDTVLSLGNDKIRSSKINDATSQSGQFTIGSAIVNKLTLQINNMDDTFSSYDFTGAIIRPSVGLQLSSTIETLNKGVFTADDPKAMGSVITLTALDNMIKFDKPFKDVTINFPTTNLQLLQAVCLHCGVHLETSTFLNSNHVIASRPDDVATSCREIVSWIAQMARCFARCNTMGALELKWYGISAFESEDRLDGGIFDNSTPYASGDNADGGNFTDYNSGDSIDGGNFISTKRYHHLYTHFNTPTVSIDDVVITGLQVTVEAEEPITVLYGLDGYVVSIEGNRLIQSQSDAEQIANSVGAQLVGMRFRPLTATIQSDPSIEAGDVAYVSTRKGNSYQTLITSTTYGVHQQQRISCDAESPLRNSSTRYSESTKTIVQARKEASRQLNAYDLAIQQLTNLLVHSFGLHKTEEIQPDGGKIFYSHNKPTLAESQYIWKETAQAFAVSNDGGLTWNSGWDANGNAVFNVLSAIGINSEWIKVLTSFTVGEYFSVDSNGHLISKSGDIGPFNLNEEGFFSKTIHLFESANYPLLWMTEPDEDLTLDNDGSFAFGGEKSARANYEPSASVVRKVENGILTSVAMMARTALDTGKSGTVAITKQEAVTGEKISEFIIDDGGVAMHKYSGGIATKSFTYDINSNMLIVSDSNTGKSMFIILDTDSGKMTVQADEIHLNGDVYINNILQ